MRRRSATYWRSRLDQVKRPDWPDPADTTQYAYTPPDFDLQSITRPLIETTRLDLHDAAGFPGLLTDVNGQVQSFTYDRRGSLIRVSYQEDGSTKRAEYNQAELVESTFDEDDVTRSYAYESAYGRLAEVLNTQDNHIVYGYDDQGKLISMSYRDPQDSETRLKRWSYEHPTYPGLLWKDLQADGTVTQYAYDAAGHLTAGCLGIIPGVIGV